MPNMSVRPSSRRARQVIAITSAAALATLAGWASASVVVIDADTVATEQDFLDGQIDGVDFVLGPDLTFVLEGTVGTVGSASGEVFDPFDFLGSTFEINDGGQFGFSNASLSSVVANTTINVNTGGAIGAKFIAAAGAEVHILGGSIDRDGQARQGSVVSMTDGWIDRDFSLFNSQLHISGGTVDEGLQASNSLVNLSGGHIFSALLRDTSTMHVTGGQATSGITLQSGSAIHISGGDVRRVRAITGASVQMSGGRARILDIDGADSELDVSDGTFSSLYLRDHASARIAAAGGGLEDFSRETIGVEKNASLTVVGEGFRFLPSMPNQAFAGVLPNGRVLIIAFNDLGDSFEPGSVTFEQASAPPVDLTPISLPEDKAPAGGLRPGQFLTVGEDGRLPKTYNALGADIVVNAAGLIDEGLLVVDSTVTLDGGVIDLGGRFLGNSTINVLDGFIVGPQTIGPAAILSVQGGTFENFAVSGAVTMTGGQGDRVAVGLGGAFDIRGGEIGILIANSSGVISGGTIGDQSRIRLGAVEMSGGTIGNGLAVEFDALLSMSGDAHIGNGFTLRADLDMRSGTIGDNFFIDGGDARIVGGSVGNNTIVRDGALTLDTQPGRTAPTIGSIAVQAGGNLQIEAGSGDDRVAVFPGGSLHVAGGVLAGPFVALPAATFDLTVLDATLAGIPLDLPLFEPTVINERDGLLLELVLADGSPLELILNPSPLQDGSDYIHPNATLRLTRVPTPSATLPLALAAIAVRRRRR